jgi:hypothetical protein
VPKELYFIGRKKKKKGKLNSYQRKPSLLFSPKIVFFLLSNPLLDFKEKLHSREGDINKTEYYLWAGIWVFWADS